MKEVMKRREAQRGVGDWAVAGALVQSSGWYKELLQPDYEQKRAEPGLSLLRVMSSPGQGGHMAGWATQLP